VLDAELFKAVIAIAPVTDLGLLKIQARNFSNSRLVADFVGSGPHVSEGSPADQARRFKAPVLMFHGERDVNVDVEQSRRMDRALRGADKRSELIVYPGLDHGLRDGGVRADMLRKSEAFLRLHLKL
jgi:dipeptidyl aminopeptidase/acylaminoacyl peptidase